MLLKIIPNSVNFYYHWCNRLFFVHIYLYYKYIFIYVFMYRYVYIYTYIYIYIYISERKQNAHNNGNRAQPLKRLLETLFLAIKKCTGFTTDAI